MKGFDIPREQREAGEEAMEDRLRREQTQAENEMICEKLLGWKRLEWQDTPARDGSLPRLWDVPTQPQNERTPSFTTWRDAGLILEALATTGQHPDVCHYKDGEWHCMVDATDYCDPVTFSTGPLAIRDAALSYVRSQS